MRLGWTQAIMKGVLIFYCNLGVCGMCQPMPTVRESVCHEMGQIWQKIEEQTEVQMSCIYGGSEMTCRKPDTFLLAVSLILL